MNVWAKYKRSDWVSVFCPVRICIREVRVWSEMFLPCRYPVFSHLLLSIVPRQPTNHQNPSIPTKIDDSRPNLVGESWETTVGKHEFGDVSEIG